MDFDIIKIILFYRSYITVLRKVFLQAGIPVSLIPKIHIGGDQLTRERFCGGKKLMANLHNVHEGFEILSPISAEFFHVAMKFLQLPYTELWKAASLEDVGTMRAEQERLGYKNVRSKVKQGYAASKEFFVSYVDAHIVELVCSHFKMHDMDANPSVNLPNGEASYDWAKEEFSRMVKGHVGTFTYRSFGKF